jgi:uncharacterized protein with FMN-binding domain
VADLRALATRAGLGLASLLLGAVLIGAFRAPETDVAGGATADGSGAIGSTAANGSGGASSGTSSSSGVSPSATASSGGSTSGSGANQTITGSLISTRFGDVQVQVTLVGGRITGISAVALPSGGRSGMISAYAEPILDSEALAAQSANIDLVSGATYTSRAYERSLQAALDKAGA